ADPPVLRVGPGDDLGACTPGQAARAAADAAVHARHLRDVDGADGGGCGASPLRAEVRAPDDQPEPAQLARLLACRPGRRPAGAAAVEADRPSRENGAVAQP